VRQGTPQENVQRITPVVPRSWQRWHESGKSLVFPPDVIYRSIVKCATFAKWSQPSPGACCGPSHASTAL